MIAFDLGISPRTVEIYRANVMTKTGANHLPGACSDGLAGRPVQDRGAGQRLISAGGLSQINARLPMLVFMGSVNNTLKEHRPTAAAQSAPGSPVIIIVDDDFAVRNSLAFVLTEEGFVVRTYCSAEMLLDGALAGDASCLVIDQKLPGLSGLVDELRRRNVQRRSSS